MTARKLQNVPVLGVDLKPLGVLDIRVAMEALLESFGSVSDRMPPHPLSPLLAHHHERDLGGTRDPRQIVSLG